MSCAIHAKSYCGSDSFGDLGSQLRSRMTPARYFCVRLWAARPLPEVSESLERGASRPGRSGRMTFFSEMCRKCNHQRAVCLYCQIQATHRGTCHACLNRLRHRHHRCSRPRRLLSPRSGRNAATTQTWIERIGRVAFIFACNHLSPTQQMPAPVEEIPDRGFIVWSRDLAAVKCRHHIPTRPPIGFGGSVIGIP
jgi:hypothetical protein